MKAEVKKKQRKKSTTKKTSTSVSQKKQKKYVPSELEVRERAYEIFINRGCEHGYHAEDWIQAEQELRRN